MVGTTDAGVKIVGPSARGGRCSATVSCQAGLSCAPLPGGYCASSCGVTGEPCDGTCVETGRAGEVCAATCASDADCRSDEGYVCDPQWHACLIPNFAALVPASCPAGKAPPRDASFAESEPWSTTAGPGVYQLEPSAVLTADGGVIALYMGRGARTDGNALGIVRVDGKGQRAIDVAFKSERANHYDPWLARARDGTLYAAWLGFDTQTSNQEIALASSKDHGITWSKPIAVHEPSDCVEGTRDCLDKPMVAVGADALYVMYAAGENGLRVRTSRDGGKTFGAPVTALAGSYGNAAIGSDGKLHLVTINGGPLGGFGSAHQLIQYTVSADRGASFSSPITISGRDEVLPFLFANPSIAVDTKRKWLYAAYVRGGRDAKWEIVLAASKDGGVTWKRTKLAGDGCAIHMVPNLALDPTTGRLHVAYYDNEGVLGRFAHASCGIGITKCTQLGAINSVPFGNLRTVRHSASWVGEYESLIIDDKRRLLHAVWAQPVLDAGRVVTRIFHAQAKLKK